MREMVGGETVIYMTYIEVNFIYLFKKLFIYCLSEKEEKKTVGLWSGSCPCRSRFFQRAVRSC